MTESSGVAIAPDVAGERRDLMREGRARLLDVLREQLRLTGTNKG